MAQLSDPIETVGSSGPRYQVWCGENLDGLALSGTHGPYHLAYLDPPYNTRRQLRYRDRFGRAGEHKTWIEYMRTRLVEVRKQLHDDGLVAISIDVRELAHLLLLCDDIFGEEHRVALIVQRVKAAAGLSNSTVMDVCEYLVVYARSSTWRGRVLHRWEPLVHLGEYRRRLCDIGEGELVSDDEGISVSSHTFRIEPVDESVLSGGSLAGVFCTTNSQGVGKLRPHVPDSGLYRVRHRPSKGPYAGQEREIWFLNGRVVVMLDGVARIGVRGAERRVRETTLWDDHWYQGLGAEGGVRFTEGKKPVAMLRRILSWFDNDIAVLDPFAGSGSIVHAVAEANRDDGGSRRVVAITNDESGICTEVCWPRVRGVVSGLLADGRVDDGLPGIAELCRIEP